MSGANWTNKVHNTYADPVLESHGNELGHVKSSAAVTISFIFQVFCHWFFISSGWKMILNIFSDWIILVNVNSSIRYTCCFFLFWYSLQSMTCPPHLCVCVVDLGQLWGETSWRGRPSIRGEGTCGQLQTSVRHRNRRHPAFLCPGRGDRYRDYDKFETLLQQQQTKDYVT